MPKLSQEFFIVAPVHRFWSKRRGTKKDHAGLKNCIRELLRDPCTRGHRVDPDSPICYQLSGPLEPVVCGTHLKNDWRLAYTTIPNEEDRGLRDLVVLMYGPKDDKELYGIDKDMWEFLHTHFGVTSPAVDHDKPPCCTEYWPAVDADDLDQFEHSLRMIFG